MHTIAPLSEPWFEGLYYAFDMIAREERYLAFVQAPLKEESFDFYRKIVAHDYPAFVALYGELVAGWCDVLPLTGGARAHIGTLGIGLVPEARHLGLGARLMETALAKARDKGFTRIELTVRADNHNARALYQRFGFCVEAMQMRGFRIGGSYFDCHAMALLL